MDPDYPQLREWIAEVKIRLRGGDDDGPFGAAALLPRPRPPELRQVRRWA